MGSKILSVPAVSRVGAWLLFFVSLALMVTALWRGLQTGEGGVWVFGAMALVPCVPLWATVHMLGRRMEIDDQGLFVYGALWGRTRISRGDVKRISLTRGRAGARGLSVRAGHKKAAISTMNKGFFKAARRLLAWAEADGIKVRWPLFCDKERWFNGR